MNKSIALQAGILKLILNNVPFAGLGDASGLQPSAAPGDIYIRLHNTDLVDEGNVGTEASYAGYVAGGIAVSRDGSQWNVDDNLGKAVNVNELQFGKCTDSGEVIRYWSIWKDNVSQALADRLWQGQFDEDETVLNGRTLIIPAGFAVINEN